MFFGEFLEDGGEDRDHEHDDRDQHDDREPEDQHRVHHRRFDLTLERVGFLHLEGDAVERFLEPARLLAGADHRPVEAVEDPRVALHRLLEGAAGFDVGAQAGDRLVDRLVLGLLLERVEGAQHRHARGDEGRELTREDGQLAHVDALPAFEEVLDVDRLALLGDVEDDQAALAQLLGDLRLRLGLNFAGRSAPARSIALKVKVVAPAIG